jgi:microcystin-dependent protein
MVFVPIIVDATTPRSARLMDFFETQFSEAKLDIDVHLHDDLYYEKAICDTKFFSLTHMGAGSNLDADLIDSQHFNELIGSLLPPGIGFAWNGDDTNIPSGWHIGDGSTQNGIILPDTRGKFVLGAGNAYAAHATGGRASISDAGGLVTIGSHLLTVAEIPSHYHNWLDTWPDATGTTILAGSGQAMGTSTQSGTTNNNHDAADEAHDHGTKTIAFNTFSIIPYFMSKYIIFKCS